MIHVVIPYFRARNWLKACLTAMERRQSTNLVHYSVVNMDPDDPKPTEGYSSAMVHEFKINGVGGSVLPDALKFGTELREDCEITVLIDPDAIVLVKGWDAYLLGLMERFNLCGINPRSGSREFKWVPEWNWMAFHTKWWQREVGHFDPGRDRLHDIGHVLAEKSNDYFVWTHYSNPFAGKAAAIVNDNNFGNWVFHAFYSSRKFQDTVPDSEWKGILTEAQEQQAIHFCTKDL